MSDIANLAITFLKGFEMLELLHDPVVNTIGWLIALCLLILAFLQGDIIRGNKKTIKALLADLANMRETYDKEYEVNNKNTLENNHILVKRNTDLKSETSELEYKNRKLSAKNKELQDKLDTFRLSIDKELENKLVNAHNSHEDKVADSGEDLPEWHASITNRVAASIEPIFGMKNILGYSIPILVTQAEKLLWTLLNALTRRISRYLARYL